MPRYSVTEPGSGRVYVFEGDSAPTEQEIAEAIRMDPTRKPASAEDFTPSSAGAGDLLAKIAALFPMAGGMVGGLARGPVGAAVGGAAGEGFQQLAEHASELPGAISDVARNLIAEPKATISGALKGSAGGAVEAVKEGAIQGAAELGGQMAGKYIVQPIARGVMRGYIKPSLAGANIKEARAIVDTAIEEGLAVTKGGEKRAGRLIAELNQDINSTLAKVKGKIDLRTVADRVRRFAKAKYYKPGVDDADYRAALDVADAIDNHASLSLPNGAKVTGVNAVAANDIKQAVRPPSRAYGTQSYVPETATRKVAGSVMREAIEKKANSEGFDRVASMNAREGRIIDAQEAISRAAGREENKGLNPTAVPNLIAGAAGGAEFGRKGDPYEAAVAALGARLLLSPAVMTRAAILASRLGQSGHAPAAAARIAIEAVRSEGARSKAEQEP